MNKRLSRKQMFSNEVSLTKDDDVYVGIDVHKRSYSVAIWINDASVVDFAMPAEAHETRTTIDEYKPRTTRRRPVSSEAFLI